MSISQRVFDAVDAMQKKEVDAALIHASIALDATAKKSQGKGGRLAYKSFIHSNLNLITKVALGTRIANIHLAYDHPEVDKDVSGLCSVQSIFYHAVRCGLLHAAELPATLNFHDKKIIAVEHGKLVLPSSFVYGLVVAVVGAPCNAGETSVRPTFFNIAIGELQLPIPIEKAWGRRAELEWLLEVVDWNVAQGLATT